MTQRTSLLAFAFLLLAACGGGGGGGAPAATPNPTPTPDPDPTPDQVALQLLEDCGPGALTSFQTYMEVVQAILTGANTVTIIDATMEPETLTVQVDLDNNNQSDGDASISFRDTGSGEPTTVGWTVEEIEALLLNGISELPALLTGLDGITMVIDATVPGQPLITGALSIDFVLGLPTTADGEFDTDDGMCQVAFDFTGQPLAGLLTPFPTGTMTTSMVSGTDTLAGTVVMNGTAIATASLALNGGAASDYTINLTTGEVQAAP